MRNSMSVTPRLTRAVPVIFVADVQTSAKFFRDTLGFSIDFLHGDPPFYGAVSRDGACLHIKFVHHPVIAAGAEDDADFINAFVEVDNLDALYTEYTEAGATFHQTLRTESWGGRDFVIRDPDGNAVCFASRVV
jgi:catechol 2,3-dioxygenase-like lactoylglutathione lyase family enzyme